MNLIQIKKISLVFLLMVFISPLSGSTSSNWGWSSTQNGYNFIVRVSFDDLVWIENEQVTVGWEIEWSETSTTHDWGLLQAFTYSLEIDYPSIPVSFFLAVDNSPSGSGFDSGTTLHTPPIVLSDGKWVTPYMSVILVRTYDFDVSFEFGVGWVRVYDPSLTEPDITTTTKTTTILSTITGTNFTETVVTTTTESSLPIGLNPFVGLLLLVLVSRKYLSKN